MGGVSIVGQEVLEFLVWALRSLVDAYIGVLPTLEPRLEILVCSCIVGEFEPSPVDEVPGHVVLGLVVRTELGE